MDLFWPLRPHPNSPRFELGARQLCDDREPTTTAQRCVAQVIKFLRALRLTLASYLPLISQMDRVMRIQ